jgi:hypothetical protein
MRPRRVLSWSFLHRDSISGSRPKKYAASLCENADRPGYGDGSQRPAATPAPFSTGAMRRYPRRGIVWM